MGPDDLERALFCPPIGPCANCGLLENDDGARGGALIVEDVRVVVGALEGGGYAACTG